MIEQVISVAGDVIVSRDTDTGTLTICCIDGVTIDIPPGGVISVDDSGLGRLERLVFYGGVPDSPVDWSAWSAVPQLSPLGQQWDCLYGHAQTIAGQARVNGNSERERTALDILHIMDKLKEDGHL